MKWIALAPIFVLTACGFRNTEVVEYRQVNVAPVVTTRVVGTPVVATTVVAAPVIATPVIYETPIIYDDYDDPIDVTTTTIDYY